MLLVFSGMGKNQSNILLKQSKGIVDVKIKEKSEKEKSFQILKIVAK